MRSIGVQDEAVIAIGQDEHLVLVGDLSSDSAAPSTYLISDLAM